MPVKDGLETLREIIAIAPTAFVAMVTAHSSIDHVKASVELGAKGFVVKPYSLGKIEDIRTRPGWTNARSPECSVLGKPTGKLRGLR
jgi:DNA-binding response OmpR family regulator